MKVNVDDIHCVSRWVIECPHCCRGYYYVDRPENGYYFYCECGGLIEIGEVEE
jgi:hypothetical protein